MLEGHCKVSPEPSLLQAENSQFSQSLFVEEVLQPFDHLCSPSSGPNPTDPYLSYAGGPRAECSVPVGSHKSRVEGENQVPRPTGHTYFDAAGFFDAAGLISIPIFCTDGRGL